MAGAVEAARPDGQLLAGVAEEHFLVGVEAAQTPVRGWRDHSVEPPSTGA